MHNQYTSLQLKFNKRKTQTHTLKHTHSDSSCCNVSVSVSDLALEIRVNLCEIYTQSNLRLTRHTTRGDATVTLVVEVPLVPLLPEPTVAFIYDRTMCKQRVPKKGDCMCLPVCCFSLSFVTRSFTSPQSLSVSLPLPLILRLELHKFKDSAAARLHSTRLHYQTQPQLILKVATRKGNSQI